MSPLLKHLSFPHDVDCFEVSEGFLLENWQQIRCMKRSRLRGPLCMLSINSLCSLTLRGEIWWLSRLGASASLLIDSNKPWLESREQTRPLGLFVLCRVQWGGTAVSCFVSCVWSGMASCSRRCWCVQVLGKENRRGIKDSGWAGFPASDDDFFSHAHIVATVHLDLETCSLFTCSSVTTLGTRRPESLCFFDSRLQNRNSEKQKNGPVLTIMRSILWTRIILKRLCYHAELSLVNREGKEGAIY